MGKVESQTQLFPGPSTSSQQNHVVTSTQLFNDLFDDPDMLSYYVVESGLQQITDKCGLHASGSYSFQESKITIEDRSRPWRLSEPFTVSINSSLLSFTSWC